MCWNKEVSLFTFITAALGIIYLYKRNGPSDRQIALFGSVIAMIQLLEYFMWSDPDCGWVNNFASMFALLILALEPLSIMIGGIYLSDTPDKLVLKTMLLSYMIFISYIFFTNIHNKNIDFCGVSECSDFCHLKWNFLYAIPEKSRIIWTVFLMLPFLTITPRYQGIILFVSGIISYFMTSLNNTGASMWCWYANAMIYLQIIL
jgi:hypothetical protein